MSINLGTLFLNNMGLNIFKYINKRRKKQENILFHLFEYKTNEEYLDFIRNITPEQSVLILVSATSLAQSKGIYTANESESIITAIRKLTVMDSKPNTEFDTKTN